jgi:hypothetical protein
LSYEVPFVLSTEGLGIVETLEEHFEIMNLEVDVQEDYVGPLTGMDFAKCPTADSLTNVHNVEVNNQCSSASQANIREITTQIEISFASFSSTISGNSLADFIFGDALKCLSPCKPIRKPLLKPHTK